MLILPLHRPITRATFPVVTALLVLLNVFFHFGPQSGDEDAIGEAMQAYAASGLPALEAPAYERFLVETGGRGEQLRRFRDGDEDTRARLLAEAAIDDAPFAAALHDGRLFPNADARAQWALLRAHHDARLADIFTVSHFERFSEIDPWRMLSATFLHADALHLFGNMLFLIALGLLVEGAIGGVRFLLLYLACGFASAGVSLAWHWGEAGAGLGASGAIAGLMGAFCVVWGRRPVRFFYWIGPVFDYVRAPAILLLPAWLGWEVISLVADQDSNVAFEAHAGGIVAGALLGWLLVAMRQTRDAFMRDDTAPARDDRWDRAQAHLGRMQLHEADAVFAELEREQPQRLDVRIARYRVARNGGRGAAATQRGLDALALQARDANEANAQAALVDELGTGAISADVRLSLARHWMAVDAADAAERALRTLDPDALPDAQAQAWFALALAYRDQHAGDAHVRSLRMLLERHPAHPQAAKARFLLENG